MKKFYLSVLTTFLLGYLHAQVGVKPNIIFITLDDCNDYVQGFSGHPQCSTPNIKYLESRGTTFLDAYASAPQCAPSRTSFITGKDCAYTHVYHNFDLKCNIPFRSMFNASLGNQTVYTIPQILKDEGGYYTYSISKIMHCHEQLPDFDSADHDICNRDLSWNMAIHFDVGGDQDEVSAYGLENELGVLDWGYCVLPDTMEHSMQDYIAADSAISFINRFATNPTATDCDKPFFLAVGFRRPHGPEYIPEHYYLPYFNENFYQYPYQIPYNNPVGTIPPNGVVMAPQPVPMWQDYYNLPDSGVAQAMVQTEFVHQGVLNWVNNKEATTGLPLFEPGLSVADRDFMLGEAKRADMTMSYLAAIRFSDAQVGRLITALKSHPDIYNNTIIVILGDHGYSTGEKAHWKKGCLWETDIRVPLVIVDLRNPKKQQCKRFVSLLDLFPTICDMAGVTYPTFPDGSHYLDGFSLTPLLANPKTPWTRPVLSSFKNTNKPAYQGGCFPSYSVRSEDWHYIKYATNGINFPVNCNLPTSQIQEELYHIGKNKEIDPYEWNNLIDDPAYASELSYLREFLPDGDKYMQFGRSEDPTETDDLDAAMAGYPNPASTSFNLSLMTSLGTGTIEIYNILGEKVASYKILTPDGQINYSIDVSNYEQGYYIAVFKQDDTQNTINFIVAR